MHTAGRRMPDAPRIGAQTTLIEAHARTRSAHPVTMDTQLTTTGAPPARTDAPLAATNAEVAQLIEYHTQHNIHSTETL